MESIPNPTPPPSAQLHHTQALAYVGEYVRIVCTLALNTPTAPFDETTWVLHLFHPLVEVDFRLFVDDFHHEIEVILNWEAFICTLASSPHLSSSGPSGMVYELLWYCFVLHDFTNGFDLFFKVCGHIVRGHIPPTILHLFSTSWLLALEKQYGGIRPIAISEVTYCSIAYTLVIQFKDTFIEHFNFHQFGVTTCGRCETLVHSIWTMLNLHPNWVVLQVDVCNTFNSMLRLTIFQELWTSLGFLNYFFPFVQWFYTCPSPLYYSQVSRHGDFIVISLELSIQQGDPLGGALFILAHLHVFHPTQQCTLLVFSFP